MNTWYAIAPKADATTEISIFDEIGMWGVSAKQFITDLKQIPSDHKILLRIHSPGGEVFDGNAIYNALQNHKGGVEVQIEGLAASMATVIALTGAPVRMAANGFYMIHNPWGIAAGDAAELRDQAELLDKIRLNMVNAYAARSKQSAEQITAWMDAETWFTAQEAKDAGFVDEITNDLALAASADRFSRVAKFRNAPAALLTTAPDSMSKKNIKASAPVEEPTPATPEPTPAPAAPAQDEPAPAAPADATVPSEQPAAPAAPVATLTATADAVIARYNAAIAERDSALAEAAAAVTARDSAVAERDAARAALERLEQSLGLQAAKVVPIIEPGQDGSDPVSEYLAAVESGDRKKAAELFAKHKDALWASRKQISKA